VDDFTCQALKMLKEMKREDAWRIDRMIVLMV